MKLSFYFPKNFRDVLGFRIGFFYADCYLSWSGWPSIYMNFHGWWNLYRYRINLPWFWEVIPDRSNPDYLESSHYAKLRARCTARQEAHSRSDG